jgi:hypothetical protein
MGGRGGSSQPDSPPPKATFSVGAKEFKSWFDKPESNLVIPNLPSHIKEVLGTEANSLIFSTESLEKQKKAHNDLSEEDYVNVLNKAGGCKEIYDRGDRHIGLLIEAGRPYLVVIKPTMDKREAYMVSMRKLENRHVRKLRAKGKRL